jgi:hypothetical protein
MVFVQDSCKEVVIRHSPIAHNYPGASVSAPEAEWFARPVKVGSGTLNGAAGNIFSHQFLPSSNIFPWFEKFQAWGAARFTLCYDVTINCTPFHAGYLRFAWNPITGKQGADFSRTANAVQYQLPGACVDLQECTRCCVRIPFCNNVPFVPLRLPGEEQAVGTFLINQLHPTSSPIGTVPPTYTVYLHLEDVELIGPVARDLTATQPQSGVMSAYKSIKDRASKYANGKAGILATAKGINEDLQQSKAISTVLSVGSKVAYAVGKIPLIPSGANAVGWMLRYAADTAAKFGYSKPMANSTVTRVMHMGQVFDGNCTGEEPGANLSLFHDSALPVAAPAGTEFDEMSVAYIAGVPGLVSRFDVNDQIPETLVYSFAVSPATCFYQGSNRYPTPVREILGVLGAAPFPAIYPTPAFMMNQCAEYWSGDLELTFHFVKTRFHTGRVSICYTPAMGGILFENTLNIGTTSYPSPTFQSTAALERTVVDMRNSSEVTIRIPYTSFYSMTYQQGHTGVVSMHIIDPIEAPGTVLPQVTVIVSSAWKNLKLAGYRGLSFAPTNNNSNVVTVPQGADLGPLADFGESIDTIAALTRKMHYRTVLRQPFSFQGPTYTPNITAPTASSAAHMDLIDVFRSAFAFERGGAVVSALDDAQADKLSMVRMATPDGIRIGMSTAHPRDVNHAHTIGMNNRNIRAYVPRYCVHSCVRTDRGGVAADTSGAFREPSRIPPGVTYNFGSAPTTALYGRACADDHQFLYFLGFPGVCRATLS